MKQKEKESEQKDWWGSLKDVLENQDKYLELFDKQKSKNDEKTKLEIQNL